MKGARSLRSRSGAARRVRAHGWERISRLSSPDLYSAVYYRLLVSHAPLDAAYADTLIDQLFPAFELPPE
jgi:hypothetical protein